MNQKRNLFRPMALAAVGLLTLAHSVSAAPFTFSAGDLLMGFRLTNSPVNDVVINLGQASSFIAQPAGTTITVSSFVPAQLVTASFNNYNRIAWSAFTAFLNGANPDYPFRSIFITVPRTSPGVQSTPPTRFDQDSAELTGTVQQMQAIISGAIAISSSIGADAVTNTANFVTEPISASLGRNLGAFIGGAADSTQGTFQDNWPANAENGTGTTIAGSIRNDLYALVPSPFTDPNTGLNSGDAYYVGYFQLRTNGVVTFTRSPIPDIPAPVISVTRSNTTSFISFASTNTAIYKLYFTNSVGLTNLTANWPSPVATQDGNNTTNTFVDTTATTNRFYRVLAQ